MSKTVYAVFQPYGEYEERQDNLLGIYMTEEAAIEACKNYDEKVKEIPEFKGWGEEDAEGIDGSWDCIMDEYYTYIEKHPEEFANMHPNSSCPGFWDEHERIIKHQDDVLFDIIRKYYPDWSDEKIKQQKEMAEDLEYINIHDYAPCYYQATTLHE